MARNSRLLVLTAWVASLAVASTLWANESEDLDKSDSTTNKDTESTEAQAAVGETPPPGSKKAEREKRRQELQAQVDALLARDPQKEDYVDEERCISTSRIRRTEVLDDRHVAFKTGRNQYYLVQFERRCHGMRRGRPPMIESRSSQLCVHDTIRPLYENGLGGFQPGVPCYIPGFQSVTKEQIDGLKALFKARGKLPKTPA